jgi:hypothetical protein
MPFTMMRGGATTVAEPRMFCSSKANIPGAVSRSEPLR